MTQMFAPLTDDEIASKAGVAADPWTVVSPVPVDAKKPTTDIIASFGPAGFKYASGWRYLNANGELLGFIVRYEPNNAADMRKEFRPITLCKGPNGTMEWRPKAFSLPRPLYGLDHLAKRPTDPVLVVEGEKAADAARKLFPQFVVVTSPGGSNGSGKADWTPLTNRVVTIWPDADEAGDRYAADVAATIRSLSIAVSQVSIPKDFPKAWDLADTIPVGHDAARLLQLIQNATRLAGWENPIALQSTLPPVEAFIAEMLPSDLGDYILDIARRQQAPADFAAVATLCGVAAIVGNRVRIAPKQNDDWVVVPNLWGAIIGRPSAMKSPTMKSGLAMVFKLEAEMKEAWLEDVKSASIDDALSGLDVKDAKKRAEKALKGGDREGARTILSELADGDQEEPPCPRIVVNDASVEKLGELLNENARGLLLIRDELPGFLARLESEEHQSERAFYLESFNGDGNFTYDRIGRGTIRIENCTLSIIGGVQPSRIAPIVRGAINGASNDGLIQRLQMAVWPDDISQWSWIDEMPDRAAKERFEQVFRELHTMNLGAPDYPMVLHFSASAQQVFREWMTEIQTDARSGKFSSTMESHLLKMPKTVASLALLFELIEGGRVEVGEQATLRALAWADYLRSHAIRLYASGETMAENGARLIVERRSDLPELFSLRDVHQKEWAGLADRGAVAMAIDLLIATNHCKEVPKPASSAGGRPTAVYQWHPTLRRVA